MNADLESGLAWQAARAHHFATTGCSPGTCPHDAGTITGSLPVAWIAVARILHDAVLHYYGLAENDQAAKETAMRYAQFTPYDDQDDVVFVNPAQVLWVQPAGPDFPGGVTIRVGSADDTVVVFAPSVVDVINELGDAGTDG